MYQKVVVRYTDGSMVRGFAEDFSPAKGSLMLSPDGQPEMHLMVRLRDVKAVFFVKELYGDPERLKTHRFSPDSRAGGNRVMVVFKDGERIWGYMNGRTPAAAEWFFLFPADVEGNNEKVFVLRDAISTIHHN